MGVSLNGGTPKSSILIGFSIINHPFWGTPIFGSIHWYPRISRGFWAFPQPPNFRAPEVTKVMLQVSGALHLICTIDKKSTSGKLLGGETSNFLFSTLPGEMIQFDSYFSTGLKPPTRKNTSGKLPFLFGYGYMEPYHFTPNLYPPEVKKVTETQ